MGLGFHNDFTLIETIQHSKHPNSLSQHTLTSCHLAFCPSPSFIESPRPKAPTVFLHVRCPCRVKSNRHDHVAAAKHEQDHHGGTENEKSTCVHRVRAPSTTGRPGVNHPRMKREISSNMRPPKTTKPRRPVSNPRGQPAVGVASALTMPSPPFPSLRGHCWGGARVDGRLD